MKRGVLPLKLAKLSQPRTEGLVLRERIFRLMDEAPKGALVWVSAPPGAGKTSLVSTYVQARRTPVLWFQVDSADADPGSFMHYLNLSVTAGLRPAAARLPQFVPEHLKDTSSFARHYFRQLQATCPQGFTLVLDNLQEVPDQAPLHAMLVAAGEELNDVSRILAVSRAPPPPAYARLKLIRKLHEIDSQTMRLTLEETRALAAAHDQADGALVATLHQHTAGWAAGIVLLIERLRQTGRISDPIASENLESVFDYFAGLLFDSLSKDVRTALMRMAYLPRLTADSAQAMTGDPAAPKLLAQLSKRNLFVDRRYTEDATYQFHALFRAFLLQQAGEHLGATDHFRAIHSAAALLRTTGQGEDAFDLYVRVGAWEPAIDLLKREGQRLVYQGRGALLLRWLSCLPAHYHEQDPWLVYYTGLALSRVDFPRSVLLVTDACERFKASADTHGEMVSLSAILETLFLGSESAHNLEPWTRRMLHLLHHTDGALDADTEARARIWLTRALFVSNLNDRALQESHAALQELCGNIESTELRMLAAATVLHLYWWSGDRTGGESFIASMAQVLDTSTKSWSPLVHWLGALAEFYLATGQLDKAEIHAHASESAAEAFGIEAAILYARRIVANVAFWKGDIQAARETLENELLPRLDKALIRERVMFHLNYARVLLTNDSPTPARIHLQQAARINLAAGHVFADFFMHRIAYQIAYALGDLPGAQQALDALRAIAPPIDNTQQRLARLLLEAHYDYWRGQPTAKESLRAALAHLETYPTWSFTYSAGTLAGDLLAFGLRQDIDVVAIDAIIRRENVSPPAHAPEAWPWPLKIYTLRRFQVLRHDSELFRGKRGKNRLLDLLALLVAAGEEGIAGADLMDALWPDADGDAASNSLQVGIFRLRKLLAVEEVIVHRQGRWTLNSARCWVDAWVLQRVAAKGAKCIVHLSEEDNWRSLYHADFLQGVSEFPLVNRRRTQLSRLRDRLSGSK